MTNHVFLILDYWSRLKDLAMVQRWLDLSVKEHQDDPKTLAILNRKRQEVLLEKIKLQDEMFEIARSN